MSVPQVIIDCEIKRNKGYMMMKKKLTQPTQPTQPTQKKKSVVIIKESKEDIIKALLSFEYNKLTEEALNKKLKVTLKATLQSYKKKKAQEKVNNLTVSSQLTSLFDKLSNSSYSLDKLELFEVLVGELKLNNEVDYLKVINKHLKESKINIDVIKDIKAVINTAKAFYSHNFNLKYSFLDITTLNLIISTLKSTKKESINTAKSRLSKVLNK